MALADGWSATVARADGDPASDVLAIQKLFLPQDAAVSPSQQAGLDALLTEATRSGYPMRVALIASPSDLGSIGGLWRQPQSYAQFLGQELSLIYRGHLLVVMPNGFGLYNFATPAAARKRLAGTSTSGGLAVAAVAAVRTLAAAAGHPLAAPTTQATDTRSIGGTGSDTSWIVFAAGAMLVALAWTASLRARPPGLRVRKTTPS